MAEFISDKDKETLRQMFDERLTAEVTISLFTQRLTGLTLPGVDPQQSRFCADANQLMEEVASLSDKIRLEMYDFVTSGEKVREYRIDKIPAIVLEGGEDSVAPRFFGMPSGYEFSTFLQDILDVSNNTIELEEDTQEQLKLIERPVHIQVFVTPT